MTWLPGVTVSINGVDYTGSTLETVRITRGRTEVYEEPRAGYSILELIDLEGNGLGIQPLQRLRITIKDSAGISRPVFTGTVSDTSTVLYDSGFESGQAGAIVTVIAVGPLAKLNRRTVAFDGLPEEGDGDRIAELINLGLSTRWEEAQGTWGTFGSPSTTWATVDEGVDLDLIDQPGVYTLAQLPAEPAGYSALGQGYLAALSGRGVIWDTPDGFIAYADGNRRRDTADTEGYYEIAQSLLLAPNLTVTSTQADITNRAVVEFAGGTVIVTDPDSLGDYGLLAKQFQTILANQSQAEAWAVDYVEDHRRPTVKVGGVAIRLDGADDTSRDALLDLDVNSPVTFRLPRTFGIQTFLAFVEGVEWRLNRATAELILNVSDAALSIGSQQWNQVDPTIAWEDVAATLTWQDANPVTV